jgi:hypothetical protein
MDEAAAAVECVPGLRLELLEAGSQVSWYGATLREVGRGPHADQLRLTLDGWATTGDEWVPRGSKRLRLPGQKPRVKWAKEAPVGAERAPEATAARGSSPRDTPARSSEASPAPVGGAPARRFSPRDNLSTRSALARDATEDPARGSPLLRSKLPEPKRLEQRVDGAEAAARLSLGQRQLPARAAQDKAPMRFDPEVATGGDAIFMPPCISQEEELSMQNKQGGG